VSSVEDRHQGMVNPMPGLRLIDQTASTSKTPKTLSAGTKSLPFCSNRRGHRFESRRSRSNPVRHAALSGA
jgi:hypothetical protein